MSTVFKELLTPIELVEYLSASKRFENTSQVFHYTSLSSILNIIKSGYWIVKSPEKMNDKFEYQNWEQKCWHNIFFISFMMEQKENIGMWSLYAQPWESGVKVAIDKIAFNKWIRKTKEVYDANPDTYEVYDKTVFCVGKDVTIKSHTIAYSDFEAYTKSHNETLHFGKTSNNIIKNATGVPLLAGYIKNDAWDYEKEIRLRFVVNKNINCKAVAIKITDELLDSIEIVKGPRFQGNIEEVIKAELKKEIPSDKSLFFDRIKSIPCDFCKRKDKK